jgi:hypothetical protein
MPNPTTGPRHAAPDPAERPYAQPPYAAESAGTAPRTRRPRHAAPDDEDEGPTRHSAADPDPGETTRPIPLADPDPGAGETTRPIPVVDPADRADLELETVDLAPADASDVPAGNGQPPGVSTSRPRFSAASR